MSLVLKVGILLVHRVDKIKKDINSDWDGPSSEMVDNEGLKRASVLQ